MMQNGYYYTVAELAALTKTSRKSTSHILQQLARKRLIEKAGCLYRCNGIAMEEILKFK